MLAQGHNMISIVLKKQFIWFEAENYYLISKSWWLAVIAFVIVVVEAFVVFVVVVLALVAVFVIVVALDVAAVVVVIVRRLIRQNWWFHNCSIQDGPKWFLN